MDHLQYIINFEIYFKINIILYYKYQILLFFLLSNNRDEIIYNYVNYL